MGFADVAKEETIAEVPEITGFAAVANEPSSGGFAAVASEKPVQGSTVSSSADVDLRTPAQQIMEGVAVGETTVPEQGALRTPAQEAYRVADVKTPTLDKLSTDVNAWEEKNPFTERIANRLGVGYTRKISGGALDELERAKGKRAAWEDENLLAHQLSFLDNGRHRTLTNIEYAQLDPLEKERVRGLAVQGVDEEIKTLQQTYLSAAEAGEVPQVGGFGDEELRTLQDHPVMVALYAAKDDSELQNAIILQHPWAVAAEAMLPSIGQAGVEQFLVPGGVAVGVKALTAVSKVAKGAALARGSYALAGGFMSGEVEKDASFVEFLGEAGVDMQDLGSINAALGNRELVKRARRFAADRAMPVAAFDMLSMYLASGSLVPPGIKDKWAKQLWNAGTQGVQNPALGGLGEAAAQYNAGQDFSPLDVKLEVFGELPNTFLEPAVFSVAKRLGRKPKEFATIEKVLQQVAANPEIELTEAKEMLREVASKGMSENEAIFMLADMGFDADLLENTHTNRGTVRDYAPGATERVMLEQTSFVDTSGQQILGVDVIEKGTGGQVVWATQATVDNDTLSNRVDSRALNLQLVQKEHNDLLSSQAGKSQIDASADNVADAQRALQRAEQSEKIMEGIRPMLHQIVQDMADLYLPGQDIMVMENEASFDTTEANVFGSASYINERGRKTAVLHMNTDTLLRVDEHMTRKEREVSSFSPSAWLGVMAHEFSHVVMHNMTETLPVEVKAALHAEHRNWLAEQLKGKGGKTKLMKLLRSKEPPSARKLATGRHEGVPISRLPNVNYHLGFNEFIADSLGRQIENKASKLSGLAAKYLPRIAKAMNHMYERYKVHFRGDETFAEFMRYTQAQAQINSVAKIQKSFSEQELGQRAGYQNSNLFSVLYSKDLKVPLEIQEELGQSLDNYGLITRYGATLLQLAKNNPHIKGLQDYVKAVHQHWVTKSTWNDQAMQTLTDWRNLGGQTSDMVGKYMLALTVKSDELGRKLTNDEIAALLKDKNIDFGEQDKVAWNVIQRIEGDLANALEQIYLIEKNRLSHEYVDSLTLRESKIIELDNLFAKLRNRNYFPLTRFGKYAITVKVTKAVNHKGKAYAAGTTAHFEILENKRQRNKALEQLRRQFPKSSFSIQPNKISEEMQAFTGLPMEIFRSLKDNPKLALSEDQKKAVQGMMDKMSPSNSIAKRMLERKTTEGFSLDGQRGYANYMMSMSGHIAKMQHAGEMDTAIDSIERSKDYLASQGIVNDKRTDILDHVKRHKEYILAPQNEWAGLRAFGFHWYLGFNVKSALVNLTQVPLVAYPYLASRKELTNKGLGIDDARVMLELTKAMKDAVMVYGGKPHGDADLNAMLSVLQAEGIIDESLATELAGHAHGDIISSMMPANSKMGEMGRKGLHAFTTVSTSMFQSAEKLNRRIVAIATYRLAIANGLSPTQGIDEAREALRSTQFEYARWNRAAFMRGKASTMFLFMQYLQNVLYFVIKDPGRWRYMAMMMLAAGLQGLPGAEDMLDLFDYGATWLKKVTQWGDPYTDSRATIRKWIVEMNGNPDLVMHGLASQSLGLGLQQGAEFAGGQFPNVSIDGSINMGRVIPGFGALTSQTELTAQQQSSFAQNVAGAAFTIPINFFLWARDSDPNDLREFERIMPSAMKNISQAYRWASEGGMYNRANTEIVDFDIKNPTHVMELAAKAAGFQPTRVQFAHERNFSINEGLKYYQSMRDVLNTMYAYALHTNDMEAQRDIMQRVARLQQIVPAGQQMTSVGDKYIGQLLNEALYKASAGKRALDTPFIREQSELYPSATEELIR